MAECNPDMTFSVVITSYNRPEYLVNAVRSVAEQEFPATEIVVVDDCSDFSVSELLEDFSQLPLKIVTKPFRRGASHSRNLGIDHSSCDYIAFLDDDDAFMPQRLSCAAALFARLPDCVASLCSYQFMDGRERKESPSSEWVDQEKLKKGNAYCGTSGLVIKTSVARLEKFDEEVPSGEDWELFARLSQRGHFYYSNQPLFLYRVGNHASKTNQKKSLSISQLEERFAAANKQRTWLGEVNYLTKIATQILGDLGSKQQIWQWVSFSLRKTGYLITAKVLFTLTVNKFARVLRY